MDIVQFYVPGDAADAIKIENAKVVAKLAGIEDRRLEYAYTRDGHGYRCGVTCSRDMALCLAEAWRVHAVSGNWGIVACGEAVASVFRVISPDRP